MRRRIDRLQLWLVIAFALAGLLTIALQSPQSRLAADFTIDYGAGVLVREGQFAQPYQQPALTATIHRVAPRSSIDPRLPFNKPLIAVAPAALLSLLPIEVAFRVWQVIIALLLLAAIAVLQRAIPLGRRAFAYGALALLAAVPTWATMTEGQWTPVLLLGAGLLIWCTQRDNLAIAAAGGALLAVKPQYLPAYLLVLYAARRRRSLLAACLGAAVVLLSPLLGGPSTLLAMAHNALLANQAVSIHADETWSGLLGTVAPAALATWIGFALFAAVLASLAWTAWQRRLDRLRFATLAGILIVLASPHALPHDLILLAVPAWLSIALYRKAALAMSPVAGWWLIDVALLIDLRGMGVPLAPLAITILLGVFVWRIRRQRSAPAQNHPPVALAG